MTLLRTLLGGDDEPPADTTRFLPLAAIQFDPERNVSRGGRCLPPTHPLTVSTAASIQELGLLECIGVRPLPTPIPRDECLFPCCEAPHGAPHDDGVPAHTHTLDYGFVRYFALVQAGHLVLDAGNGEVKIYDATTDAADTNLAENIIRTDPTEAQLACVFLRLQTWRGLTAEQIAARTHHAYSPGRVATMLRLAARLPPELLARWEATPTKEVRVALDRIATTVDPADALPTVDRHRAMVAAWAAHLDAEAARLAAPPSDGTPTNPETPHALTNRHGGRVGRTKAAVFRSLATQVDEAQEVYDTTAGRWVALTPAVRAALRAVLRYAADPQTPPPLR